MNNFKFFQEKQIDFRLVNENLTLLNNNQNTFVFNQNVRHDVCDYLFQINENEPVSLGRTYNNGDLTLTLSPHENANITFSDNNNNTFKIFTRPVE